MISTIRDNELCLNCLKLGHFLCQCTSSNRCRKCQKPHHTLIHDDVKRNPQPGLQHSTPHRSPVTQPLDSRQNTLLMTCRLLINAPDGSVVRVRGLLDSASSTSFVSERLVQALCLSRSFQTSPSLVLPVCRTIHPYTRLLISRSLPQTHLMRTSQSLQSLYNASPVTCPFYQSPSTQNGPTCLTSTWQIRTLGVLGRLIFSLAWISMLTHCCKAVLRALDAYLTGTT